MTHVLCGTGDAQLEVKKSRFIARAARLTDPEGASRVIAACSDPSARHNCWAWRVGQLYRFHDAGEPGGTAGRPILAAIDGAEFDQIVVVVTRHFGGIKLGTGGLVRAYGKVAAEALRTATSEPWLPLTHLRMRFPINRRAMIEHHLMAFNGAVLAQDTDMQDALLQISLPVSQLDLWRERALRLCAGKIHFEQD